MSFVLEGGITINPISLKLKNFCSIAEMELDLSALSLVGISAPNGTGKSSVFTYAPLFALFGKSRQGTSIDDMVRTGQQDMSVTFDFEHNSEVYQVIRTRKLNKKSTCEFQKQTPEGWQSLSGMTIKETDAKIEALLSLDANTFLASSMILQNDSNRFTKSLPSERKQILTQILGLDIYSTLQEKSKAKAKSLELKLEGSKQELDRLTNSLEVLPQVEADLQLAKNNVAHITLDIRQKETELADLQAQIKDLESKQLQAQQIQQHIDSLDVDITAHKAEIIALNNRIVDAETVLKSEPELLAKQQELTALRQQIPALEAKVGRLKELQNEGYKLEAEYKALENDHYKLQEKIWSIEHELESRYELQQSSEQYQQSQAELKELDELAEKWQEIRNQINVVQDNIKAIKEPLQGLQLQSKAYQTELDNNKKKLEILQNSGCPNPDNATCKFLQDAIKAKTAIPVIANKLVEIESQVYDIDEQCKPLQEQIYSLDDELTDLNYESGYHGHVKRQAESLRQQAEQFTSLSGKEELLQNLTEQQQGLTDRINTNLEQQDAIISQVAELNEINMKLYIMDANIKALEPCEKQLAGLPQAKTTIESALEQIRKLDAEIVSKVNRQTKLICDQTDDDYPLLIQAYKNTDAMTQTILKEMQADLNALFARQGASQSQFDTLTADQTKHAELSQQIAPLAKELVRYETLAKAFSKNGIPVLILENALPELERIANDILSQMSAGAHTLQFVTQRDAKSKDSQIETLDILVSDWAGTRPFESYSGGEQTRISLAIRFALSELLANRSGSKIEWIVADEVLSDQSPEFRDMTVESIKALSGRFKKILLISHIPEIQAAFDQRIILSEGGKVDIQFN